MAAALKPAERVWRIGAKGDFMDGALYLGACPKGAHSSANPMILQCAMTPEPDSPRIPAGDAAKIALAWTHTARFLTTASRLDQLPATDLPEIAFVGRSNAGKSTAINRLAQQKRLAFASRTPGRTQHVNLFEVGPKDAPDAYFADLPGYGYAAVPRSAKLRWQEVMAEYLAVRRSLSGIVLMIDSRLGFTDLDRQLLALIQPRLGGAQVRLLTLLTKADKLNRKEAQAALMAAQGVLGEVAEEGVDVGVTLFSALARTGIDDAAQVLHEWTRPRPAATVALTAAPAVEPAPAV